VKCTTPTLTGDCSPAETMLSIQTSPVNHWAGPFAVGGFG
jgi:hypothetical protein